MFNDVDESLREFLIAEMPLDRDEVDVSFERPTREWANKLTRPTLNLFMHDLRERLELRNNEREIVRNGRAATVRIPPRRIDLTYMVTAWTKEPSDEHRILARLMAALFRAGQLPEEHLRGELPNANAAVLLRLMPPDYLVKGADFWGVMDNELHASITLVATAPLDAFAPVTGPAVVTREVSAGAREEEWREIFLHVGGRVVEAGSGRALGGVRVGVVGRALDAISADDGGFRIGPLHAGDYTIRVTTTDDRVFERLVKVPSSSYDIEVAQ